MQKVLTKVHKVLTKVHKVLTKIFEKKWLKHRQTSISTRSRFSCLKFRESNVFVKEILKELISRVFSVRLNFHTLHTVTIVNVFGVVEC